MIDNSRIANIIFNRGQKISQGKYISICESIQDDRFTLDEYVLDYKKKDCILGNMFFTLKDSSRILVSENLLNTISKLDVDHDLLIEYMRESSDNFYTVVKEIVDGIE